MHPAHNRNRVYTTRTSSHHSAYYQRRRVLPPASRTKRRGKVTVEGRTFSVVEYEPDEDGNSLVEVIIDGERRVLGVGDHEDGIIEATEVLWDHHGLGE